MGTEYDIRIRRKNKSGEYDTLYPITKCSNLMLDDKGIHDLADVLKVESVLDKNLNAKLNELNVKKINYEPIMLFNGSLSSDNIPTNAATISALNPSEADKQYNFNAFTYYLIGIGYNFNSSDSSSKWLHSNVLDIEYILGVKTGQELSAKGIVQFWNEPTSSDDNKYSYEDNAMYGIASVRFHIEGDTQFNLMSAFLDAPKDFILNGETDHAVSSFGQCLTIKQIYGLV